MILKLGSRDRVEKSDFLGVTQEASGRKVDKIHWFAKNQYDMVSTFSPIMGDFTPFLRLLVYQACTRMIFFLFIIIQSIFSPETKHKRPMLNFTSQNQTFCRSCVTIFFCFYNETISFVLPFLIKLTKPFPSEFLFKNHLSHNIIMKN